MNRILITGATGFIGRNLVKVLLSQNDEIVVLTNKQENLVPGHNLRLIPARKINDLDTNFDQVIHLATYYTKATDSESILNTIACNVEFSKDVINLAKKFGSHLVMTSSYMQYQVEARPNIYVESKRIASGLASAFAEEGSLEFTEIVLHDTYGLLDSRKKIVNDLLKSVRNSSSIEISNPDQYINLAHIDDVVSIIAKELARRHMGKIEIKGPDDVKISDILKIIEGIYRKEEIPKSRFLIPTSRESTSSELYIGEINLIDGLRRIIEREN